MIYNAFELIKEIPIGDILSNNWHHTITEENKYTVIKQLTDSFLESVDYKPIIYRDFSSQHMNEFIKDLYVNILQDLKRIYQVQSIIKRKSAAVLGEDLIPKKNILFIFDSDLNTEQNLEWKEANKDWLAIEDHIWRYEIIHITDIKMKDNNNVLIESNIHRFAWRYAYNNVSNEEANMLLNVDLNDAGISISKLDDVII